MTETLKKLFVVGAIAIMAAPLPAAGAPSGGGARAGSSVRSTSSNRSVKTPIRLKQTPVSIARRNRAAQQRRYGSNHSGNGYPYNNWYYWRQHQQELQIREIATREMRQQAQGHHQGQYNNVSESFNEKPGKDYQPIGYRCLPQRGDELWINFNNRCSLNSNEAAQFMVRVHQGCTPASNETVAGFSQRCAFRFDYKG